MVAGVPADPVEQEIAAEVARAGLTRDPLGPVLAAFLRGTQAVRVAAERAREPLSPEEQQRAAVVLAQTAARELARLRRWWMAAALVGAFLAGGAVAGAAWWAWPVQTAVGSLSPEAVAVLRLNDLGAALARGREVPQVGGGAAKQVLLWTKAPAPAER
ncbi:MAG TPA: hypothetical protein VE684_12940 [Crenalkalicoccus sp.]|jgi:hypothetical protein|nr:hypothetical protein [Crenalkalicoccus sp.]